MLKRIQLRYQDSDRQGTAAVETALVLPVFIMLRFGMIEFGRGMMMSQIVVNASREGARIASVDGSTNQQVEDRVKDYLVDALNIQPGDVTVNITVDPGPGNPDPGDDVANAEPGDKCTVTALLPYNNVALWETGMLNGATLRGFSSMRHEP